MRKPIKILVADDEKNIRLLLKNELSGNDTEVHEAATGQSALDMLKGDEYDILLLDLNMPGVSGIEVLKEIKNQLITAEVVVLTAHATVTTAVEAMKLGAYDFITKPFKIEELKAVIEKAFEKKTILSENLLLKTQIKIQSEAATIITGNRQMLEILETVKKVATSDLPVLISGESGVGKELVARAVHDDSGRRGQFIPINCGAIPETMIESELFGNERGAFTGAQARKLGLLEIADNGSLFLDEIGELPQSLQVKLLRVLETKQFFRIGGVKEIKVDVKFISASNKDIKAEVGKGAFRADLYYRISALGLTVPPLRERREDIPVLIEHFKKKNPAFKRKHFSNEALAVLSQYPWPGNVRELHNLIHRVLLLSPGDTIEPCDLPPDLINCGKESSMLLDDVEKQHILAILKQAGGHRGKAAELLGINPKTLYRKLLDYGVKE